MSGRNWHLDEIKVSDAHDLMAKTDAGFIDYGDVRVAHIDTGYTNHPVFGPWGDMPGNLITDQWTNFIETDQREPLDPLEYERGSLFHFPIPGHGTRIGSVMYGDGRGLDDNEVLGVAPRAPVVPYRATNSVVLNKGNPHRGLVGKAIYHAVNETNCDLIFMCLGTPTFPDRNMGQAIDYAYDNGVIVIAASGNNVTDSLTYPGKYFRTICAAGIKPGGTIWGSHYEGGREFIDVFAPADKMYRADSALVDGNVVPGAYRDDGDGTSYATACTAGAATLWLAHRHDELRQLYHEPWMVIEALRRLLHVTAEPLAKTRPGVTAGILNIPALLTAPLPDPDALVYEKRLSRNMRW